MCSCQTRKHACYYTVSATLGNRGNPVGEIQTHDVKVTTCKSDNTPLYHSQWHMGVTEQLAQSR